MNELFQSIDFWHWWVLAVVFIVLEVFSPAAFFLWLGLSAGVIGVALLLVPTMSWELQVFLFAVFSVISTVVGRRYFVRSQAESDHPTLNRRGEQYIGRVFTLDEAIINGEGKIRVDDTTWKVRGQDMDAGKRVRVIGVEGVVLTVEELQSQ